MHYTCKSPHKDRSTQMPLCVFLFVVELMRVLSHLSHHLQLHLKLCQMQPIMNNIHQQQNTDTHDFFTACSSTLIQCDHVLTTYRCNPAPHPTSTTTRTHQTIKVDGSTFTAALCIIRCVFSLIVVQYFMSEYENDQTDCKEMFCSSPHTNQETLSKDNVNVSVSDNFPSFLTM